MPEYYRLKNGLTGGFKYKSKMEVIKRDFLRRKRILNLENYREDKTFIFTKK